MTRCSFFLLASTLLATCTGAPAEFGARATQNWEAAASGVDAARVRSGVERVVAARAPEDPYMAPFYPRPHRHELSAQFVADEFRTMGYQPVLEVEGTDPMRSENVYVEIRGERAPDEIVMLTGHHDAFFSGADDNSSAVAVLLEAARTLRDSHPDRTIRILAFDLEEYGLIGAVRHLAAHHQDRIVMVLNMDCVGFASHARGSQRLLPGLQVSDTGDFLGVFANAISATAVERLLRVAPSLQNTPPLVAGVGSGDLHSVGESPFLRSDHSPFWSAGIPALFFTDTAEFRNPNYHKVTDTVDTLDFDFLTGATRVIVAATAAYATVD